MTTNNNVNFSKLDLLDILFYNKNKEYGAYALRKSYEKHLKKALLFGLALLLLAFGTPYIIQTVSAILPAPKISKAVELGPPPSIDPAAPPPPPPPKVETPPPPPRPTVKFVPPVVKKDEEVVEEEKIATVDELKEADASTKTQEGDKNSTVVTEVVPDDLGTVEEVKVVAPEIFTRVEQMPSFPGGEKEMLKYLSQNINYPAIARENGVEGTVVLRFVINEQGKIDDIQTLRDVAAGCTEEAIRVVKTMPQWSAGKQNGRAVKVYFTLPVKFKLDN